MVCFKLYCFYCIKFLMCLCSSFFIDSVISSSITTSECHDDQQEEPNLLQSLIIGFKKHVKNLTNVEPLDKDVEAWAFLVYESMSQPSRYFHSVQHVFDISHGADSIQTLAAFFHDVVYYKVDGHLTTTQAMILNDVIIEHQSNKTIVLQSNITDTTTLIVLDIFGFTIGQTLDPFDGMNEFLSTMVAIRSLQRMNDNNTFSNTAKTAILPDTILFQISACIEATRPFRKNNPSLQLLQRLKLTNEKYNIGLTDEELVLSTKRSVNLANRDVGNFGLDMKGFLSNTFKLLPESNPKLRYGNPRHQQTWSITDFGIPLTNMVRFLSNLRADVVFEQFEDEPTDVEYKQILLSTTNNLNTSVKYLNCIRMSYAFLMSVSVLTSDDDTDGDVPVALFTGRQISHLIEDNSCYECLNNEHSSLIINPHDDIDDVDDIDDTVLSLLHDNEIGEEYTIYYDKSTSIAAYLYSHLGDSRLEQVMEYVKFPMDKESSKLLLDSFPKQLVRELLIVLSKRMITRGGKICHLSKEYE